MNLDSLVVRAVDALLKVWKPSTATTHLFTEDQQFELVVSLEEDRVDLPTPPHTYALPVKHSVYPEDADICLITCIPQRHFKDLTRGLPHIRKVVDHSKLKQKYTEIDQRRLLMRSFHIFLADATVCRTLSSKLGSQMFKCGRTVVPVNIPSDADSAFFERLVDEQLLRTPVVLRKRCTVLKLKVGRTNHTPQQVAENVQSALEALVKLPCLKRSSWSGIRSIHLKLPTTTSLPLFKKPAAAPLFPPPPRKRKGEKAEEGQSSEPAGAGQEKGQRKEKPTAAEQAKATHSGAPSAASKKKKKSAKAGGKKATPEGSQGGKGTAQKPR